MEIRSFCFRKTNRIPVAKPAAMPSNRPWTAKYMEDYGITYDYMNVVMERIRQRFSAEEVANMEHMLEIIGSELMPEVTLGRKFE